MGTKVCAVLLLMVVSAAVGSATRRRAPTVPMPQVIRDGHTFYTERAPPPREWPDDRRLDRVLFDGVPFDQAVERLRAMSGANINVRWDSLEPVSIDRAAPVDLDLHDVTVVQALWRMAADVSSPGEAALGVAVDGGDIAVGSDVRDAEPTTVRVYDVRGIFVDADDTSNLSQIITRVVAPETWRDNGGLIGQYQEIGGRLIVWHTAQTHRRIEQLLALLREPDGPGRPTGAWARFAPVGIK